MHEPEQAASTISSGRNNSIVNLHGTLWEAPGLVRVPVIDNLSDAAVHRRLAGRAARAVRTLPAQTGHLHLRSVAFAVRLATGLFETGPRSITLVLRRAVNVAVML